MNDAKADEEFVNFVTTKSEKKRGQFYTSVEKSIALFFKKNPQKKNQKEKMLRDWIDEILVHEEILTITPEELAVLYLYQEYI